MPTPAFEIGQGRIVEFRFRSSGSRLRPEILLPVRCTVDLNPSRRLQRRDRGGFAPPSLGRKAHSSHEGTVVGHVLRVTLGPCVDRGVAGAWAPHGRRDPNPGHAGLRLHPLLGYDGPPSPSHKNSPRYAPIPSYLPVNWPRFLTVYPCAHLTRLDRMPIVVPMPYLHS